MKKVIVLFVLFSTLVFSSILNYWIDPVYGKYGFSIDQNVNFWKIDALLRYDITVSWKQGFPFITSATPIIVFELDSDLYSVQYGNFHKDIPISTFVNPYSEGLNIKWGYVGFYENYQYFTSEKFEMIMSYDFFNFTVKMDDFNVFFEKMGESTVYGVLINGLVVYKFEKNISLGLSLENQKYGLYLMPLNGKIGFVLRDENNYFYLSEDGVLVSIKYGELNIFGQFKKDSKSIKFEIPIW
ncbi:MAG: hypothetical protein H0Z24_08515 [Thermosipho sp. (in: Bacteria)]|nr:hypothetical protein [Thermosipho sp. (in: thermotogales)]